MTPAELLQRVEGFSVAVLRFSEPLLASISTRDMAVQLRRAATGAAANYGAACIARSHADFTSKIGMASEEANEADRWLRTMRDAGLVDERDVAHLIGESTQLAAIFGASHRTAKRRRLAKTPRHPKA